MDSARQSTPPAHTDAQGPDPALAALARLLARQAAAEALSETRSSDPEDPGHDDLTAEGA